MKDHFSWPENKRSVSGESSCKDWNLLIEKNGIKVAISGGFLLYLRSEYCHVSPSLSYYKLVYFVCLHSSSLSADNERQFLCNSEF